MSLVIIVVERRKSMHAWNQLENVVYSWHKQLDSIRPTHVISCFLYKSHMRRSFIEGHMVHGTPAFLFCLKNEILGWVDEFHFSCMENGVYSWLGGYGQVENIRLATHMRGNITGVCMNTCIKWNPHI